MNGNSVVLDTNIVLYLLNGDQIFSELLCQKKRYLSFISQLELLGYKGIAAKQQLQVSKFIQECMVIDVSEAIKTDAIEVRKQTKLKLPDTIVLTTARFLSLPSITSSQDFKEIKSPEIIIYE
jgi:predicted nucleic acid-binding protein